MKTKILSIIGSIMLLCAIGAQAQLVTSNGLKFDSNNYVFANMATNGGSLAIITSRGFPLDSSGNLLIDCAANCTSGTGIATVATLPTGKPAGTTYVVTDGSTGTDCTGGGGANFVFCRYSGTVWGTFTAGAAGAGGGLNTLQFNSAAVLGGVAQWTTNGTTTITGSATSILDLHAAGTGGLLLPGALSTGIVKVTTTTGALSILTAPNGAIVGTSDAQALTNKDFTGVGNTFPLLNQTTTGSAAKWTTPVNLAGNSVDGSANVAFANKFIVQGTADAGLSGAQFLGALGTGLLKNTITTGVLSVASASDVVNLLQGLTGCNTATFVFTPQASDCVAPSGGGSGTVASGTVNGLAYYTAATTVGSTTPPSVNGLYFGVENVTAGATVAPTHVLGGVPVVTPTTPYTMLYSDRASYQRLTGGSTFTFNLGQITSNFASNMPFVIQNGNSGLLTLTANAADKIDNSATGGTSTLLSNFASFVYQDSSSAPGNWWTLKVPTFAAFGTTCTNGLNWSTASGIGCLSAAPVKSGDAAGGGLTGTYPNPTIANNAVAQANVTNGYVDLSSNQTVAGNKTLSGTSTFTGLVQCSSFENVQCIDSTFPHGGTDIGDEINKAYAALPAAGGTIEIYPQASGLCYVQTTDVVMTTLGKYPLIVGMGAGGFQSGSPALTGTCINYTPVTGRNAFTLDYAVNAGESSANGFKNINIINNMCITTGGCASLATAIQVGTTNAGIRHAGFEDVGIYGFGEGYVNLNVLSPNVTFNHCIWEFNGQGRKLGTIQEFGVNELFQANGNAMAASATTTPEMHWTNAEIVGNTGTPDILEFSGAGGVANPAHFFCTNCHFENGTTTSQDTEFIGGNVDIQLTDGLMESDSTLGTNSWFVSCSGESMYINGTVFTSGVTTTQLALLNSPCRGYLNVVNKSPTRIATLVGGANAANATIVGINSNTGTAATQWVLEGSLKASSISTGSTPPACTAGTAGFMCNTEGTAFTNVASAAGLYPDSTTHEYMAKTNGASSAGMMVRTQPGALSHIGSTATIATETVCAASAGACNVAGQYHVHLDMWESGTACSSITAGSVAPTLTWTDRNGTSHAAVPFRLITQASGTAFAATFIPVVSALTAFASADMDISTNGTIIQDAFTYTACTTGTLTYNADVSVTRLQ